jgi:FkbM family methyltransferase
MDTNEIRNRLNALLAESQESARDRAHHALERIVGTLDGEFVLFGAGNLGRKALKTLQKLDRKPIAFIDNNPTLWNTDINGIPIMSPQQLAARCDRDKVAVITTIWCGEATDKMSDRINPLRGLGFRRIALFGHLAWRFPDAFLPHYSLDLPGKVAAQRDRIMAAFDLFSDDESRLLFVNHVEWRLTLDYDLLPPPAGDEIYFGERFSTIDPAEVLYDVGAYVGDSIHDFLSTARGRCFEQIHSFEPAPANFERLKAYIGGLKPAAGRIRAHRLALGDRAGVAFVEDALSPAARVGRGTGQVEMTSIDEFAREWTTPTFIKIDIEGFEPQCLAGAARTIAAHEPVLAVCVYHLQSHLWDIPLQISAMNSGYSFRLCPHLADGWDLVLYAVPAGRLPA